MPASVQILPIRSVAADRQSSVPAPDRSFSRIEQLVRTYGSSYDSYIATDTAGKEFFWSSTGDGLLCTIPQGRFIFVYGGILAPAEGREHLVREFLDDSARRRLTPSFFNIGRSDAEVLRTFGFNATKFGEEPIVELDNCTWKGKPYEWVRRQTNFCRRQEMTAEEIRRDDMSADEWNVLMDELDVISDHFLEEKPHAHRMRNCVSRFCRTLLFGQRVFIARHTPSGRIDGFVVCNPCLNGRMWAIESYRKRKDAIRGVIPFLMHQCMLQFQQEDVPFVTLSMLPLIRCDQPTPGDSWLLRKVITLAHRHGSAIYDSAGLYHFKSRFRPHRFDDRFICNRRSVSPGMLIAGMKSWGFHEVSPVRALRRFLHQQWTKSSRRQLARPNADRSAPKAEQSAESTPSSRPEAA